MKRILITFFMTFVLLAHQVSAAPTKDNEIGEAYAVPTFKELTQTLVLLGGLDINKTAVVQEYAKLSYCDIYMEKYKNDFQWNEVKRLISSRILEKKEMYRLRYEIYGTIKLDRYNFEGQFFPLERTSKLVNVGSMVILEEKDYIPYCTNAEVTELFPHHYFMQLNQPLLLDAIKMPMDEAELFLKKLEELKIKDRSIYIRFRFKIHEVASVTSSGTAYKDESNYRADFLGKITQIDFFYDREMTKWITSAPIVASKM